MSSYQSPMSLRLNTYLFSDKQKELKQLVGNLKLDDVKDEERLKRTTAKIKNLILLRPVMFQEPKIIDNYQIEKEVAPNYQNMFGGKRQINVITVEYKFDGSPELFEYAPQNLSFGSSSNMRVYQPDGNAITIEVEQSTLDKTNALSDAKGKMEMTLGLINGNNAQAQAWSVTMEPTIESMLVAKRKELLDLYN